MGIEKLLYQFVPFSFDRKPILWAGPLHAGGSLEQLQMYGHLLCSHVKTGCEYRARVAEEVSGVCLTLRGCSNDATNLRCNMQAAKNATSQRRTIPTLAPSESRECGAGPSQAEFVTCSGLTSACV